MSSSSSSHNLYDHLCSSDPFLFEVSTSPAASLICPSQLESPTSTGTPELAKKRKSIDHIYNSKSKLNTSNSDVEIDPSPGFSAPHKAVSGSHRPIREAKESSDSVGSRPEWSVNNSNQRQEHLGRSFNPNGPNLMGMAEMLGDVSCDLNDVGSSLYSALVMVDGYRVKPELAPVLRAIFLKYGDIAKGCSLLSISSRSSLLEIICDIVQKLQNAEFTRIMSSDLKSMLDQVRDLETLKMEVGWLHQRLDDILEAKGLFRGYSTLMEAKRRIVQGFKKKEEEVKSFKMEILDLREKILSLNERKPF